MTENNTEQSRSSQHRNSRKKHPSSTNKKKLWKKILIAAIPAGVLGILLNNFIDKYFENMWVISATLAIYGVFYFN